MKISLALFLIFFDLSLFGQNNILKGKIIDEKFHPIPYVQIINSEKVLLTSSNNQGEFEIKMITDSAYLVFLSTNTEAKEIKLDNYCKLIEVILQPKTYYDYISQEELKKIKQKSTENILKIHLKAYRKKIFKAKYPCFTNVI